MHFFPNRPKCNYNRPKCNYTSKTLCLALEVEGVVDAGGEFFLIVGDEDKGNGWILTVFIYQALYHAAIVEVETMEGLVENPQVGLLYESTAQMPVPVILRDLGDQCIYSGTASILT